MKRNILTSSLVAATLMVGFSLVTQSAHAASPKDKFIAMKNKVLSAAKKSQKGASWKVVQGQFLEILPYSVPLNLKQGTATVQGYPLDPSQTPVQSGGSTTPIVVKGVPLVLDLNMASYQSIKFGKSENELVLATKDKSGSRYTVQLDQKSSAPVTVMLQTSSKGIWKTVRTASLPAL